jgi:hypothetical protein
VCKIILLDFFHSLNYKIINFRKLGSASVFQQKEEEDRKPVRPPG